MEKSILDQEIVPCIWCKPADADQCNQCNGVIGVLADMLADHDVLTDITRSQ